MENKDSFLTTTEAGKLIGCSTPTARRLCLSGEMAYRKIGTKILIPLSEVDRYIKHIFHPRKDK